MLWLCGTLENKMIKKTGKEYPQKDLTPEHSKRGNDHDSDNPIHPDVNAAYDYVDSVLDTSDFKDAYAWFGWGIREAFLAGASYECKNPKLQKTEDWHEDIGDCLFFHFNNFEEPPSVCCASPLDNVFDEKYWTHFIKPDFNSIFEQAQTNT